MVFSYSPVDLYLFTLFCTREIICNHHLIKLSLLFQVSIAFLIFSPVYMHFLLAETVERVPKRDRDSTFLTKIINVAHKSYESMRDAAAVVFERYLLLFKYIHLFCPAALFLFFEQSNILLPFIFSALHLEAFRLFPSSMSWECPASAQFYS